MISVPFLSNRGFWIKRLFRGVLIAAVFVASACSSDELKASAVTFEQYFNSFAFDFEPAKDRGDLAGRSTLVAEATLTDVIDGPIFGSSQADPAASRFALFAFKSAAVAAPIYVRLPRPNTSDINAIRDAMPLGARAVLYLIPVPLIPANEKQFWFGVDPKVQQWDVTTPQGFILERRTESGEAMVDLPIDGSDGLADTPVEGSDVAAWLPVDGTIVPSELVPATDERLQGG